MSVSSKLANLITPESLGSIRQVSHVTEFCLFAAAFVVAFTFGPGWMEPVRKAVARWKRF
jgi:hypothetical protein